MKRIAAGAVLAVLVAGCSGGSDREFAPYYDPTRLFATSLPSANDIALIPPQPAQGGPGILAGVVASPPQPSPSPQGGLRGFALTTGVADQTTYQAIAVTTDGLDDLDEMGLLFLTGDPQIDVQIEETVRVDEHEGRLLVVDVNQQGQVTASVAAAFTLGGDGPGFMIAAVFPPGTWDAERDDFLRILGSFRTDVPAGFATFPLTEQPAPTG